MELEYTYWEDGDGWLIGYLNIWPNHWTQGKGIAELEEMLLELYRNYKEEYTESTVIRKAGVLQVPASVIAEINILDNTSDEAAVEEKLRQLSKEGDVILAKRNKSCAKLPKITEHLDWMSVYNEVRADRL